MSGGWRMPVVALAAVLFSDPDLLLLNEPSHHLHLEAAIWLDPFWAYRGTLVVVSHERDLLNNVVDNILHLEDGKTGFIAAPTNRPCASAASGAPRPRRRRRARKRSGKSCRPISIAGATRRIPRARRKAA